MEDDDGCSFPFLMHADGSKLVLNLGDNLCIISNDCNDHKMGPFIYFLPGKHEGEILCTFSALFDGSVVLSKESNSAPEIYVNGNRVAAEVNIDVQTGDSIMLGSSRYSYIVDLNDADDEEVISNTLKLTDETFTDVFTNIFVSGDMNIDFVDFDTGKKIPLDQQLVTVARGVALSSIHQLEITGWLQWLGLLTNRTAVINRKRHLLKWNVEISAEMVDDLILSDYQSDYSYLRNLSFQLSLIQHYDNKIQGPGFSILLTKIENYCSEFSRVLKALRTTDVEKIGVLISTPSKSEKTLSGDLLSPMLSLFTWGDQAEEVKETGPGPPPPPGVPFETRQECKNNDIETRKDASLISGLCRELRRQFVRLRDANGGEGEGQVQGERGRLGTEKCTADWIKNCCSGLSSLCYYGDSTSFMEGDALSAVLEPHWAAAMESDKEDVVFRTVMITIRVMALLSVKNILHTDSTCRNGDGNGNRNEESSSQSKSRTNPYLDYSFLDPFSFTSAAPSSVSNSHKIARCQAVYLDDLRCMLRWSLPALHSA